MSARQFKTAIRAFRRNGFSGFIGGETKMTPSFLNATLMFVVSGLILGTPATPSLLVITWDKALGFPMSGLPGYLVEVNAVFWFITLVGVLGKYFGVNRRYHVTGSIRRWGPEDIPVLVIYSTVWIGLAKYVFGHQVTWLLVINGLLMAILLKSLDTVPYYLHDWLNLPEKTESDQVRLVTAVFSLALSILMTAAVLLAVRGMQGAAHAQPWLTNQIL